MHTQHTRSESKVVFLNVARGTHYDHVAFSVSDFTAVRQRALLNSDLRGKRSFGLYESAAGIGVTGRNGRKPRPSKRLWCNADVANACNVYKHVRAGKCLATHLRVPRVVFALLYVDARPYRLSAAFVRQSVTGVEFNRRSRTTSYYSTRRGWFYPSGNHFVRGLPRKKPLTGLLKSIRKRAQILKEKNNKRNNTQHVQSAIEAF